MKTGKNSPGFTLAELIFVVSLLAMVGVAIYQTVMSGLKIWERADKLADEEDLVIALDKLETDVHNTFSFSTLTFEGEPEKITFPSIIRTRADKKGPSRAEGYVDQIGIVQYAFDPLKSGLVRQQANYSDALKGDFTQKHLLLTRIDALQFTYYFRKDGQVLKKNRWEKGLPEAVEVEMRIFDETGNTRIVQRMINIPVIPQGKTDESATDKN